VGQAFQPRQIKVIGTLEVLAAIGLILPAAFGIAPVLVPLAAAGLVLLMAGAFVVHLRLGEAKATMVPVVLRAWRFSWPGAGPFRPSSILRLTRHVQGPSRTVHLNPRRSHMSPAQETSNKAAIRRINDAIAGGVEQICQAIDEIFEPDVVFHAPIPTGATGTEALKQLWPMLLHAFPDLQVTVEDLIEEGDKVVSRNTVTGTHQGEYMGMPPTGKSITYNEIFIGRFVNGRVAEIWGIVDVFAQMKQLGLIPA
jgi:predicted ester cyclase